MSFRFTIGRKIGLGFGLVIVLILAVSSLTYYTLEDSRDINTRISQVYTPSFETLIELDLMVERSHRLIMQWVFVESREDVPNKLELRELIQNEWPRLKQVIEKLAQGWDSTFQGDVLKLTAEVDSLYGRHTFLMGKFSTMASYSDPEVYFGGYKGQVEQGGEVDKLTSDILMSLKNLKRSTRQRIDSVKTEEQDSFSMLESVVFWMGAFLILGALLIALLTVRSIVNPVQKLKSILISMGRGVFPRNKIEPSNDEIGEMSVAMNTLVDGLKRTTDFSNQVGSGNFDYYYEPLSEEDILGHALLKMRDSLAANERELEQKVIERTIEIERQKQKVEELYKDVTDSIRYAKRLQDSILPKQHVIDSMLPESFVLFKPKDIVSGDFYWMKSIGDEVLFAAVDCTGHGVPGAFMSLVGHNSLNQITNIYHETNPARVLEELNRLSAETMNQGKGYEGIRDGMDMALCKFNKKERLLEYAGANNPLYLIRNKKIQQIKPDKMAIASFSPGEKQYTNHTIPVEEGDMVYIFSDGFADQFGGVKGKKFMYKRFRELLLEVHQKDLAEQRRILDEAVRNWRGDLEQIDDILVIGVRL